MKHLFCALTTLCCTLSLSGQHVGIGTTQPSELLHIKDGLVRLEGDNKYFDLYTGTNSGIRYYANNSFRGAWFFVSSTNQLNLTRSVFDKGLVFDFNLNKSFLGRDFAITSAEVFGARASVGLGGYGGMYMETFGSATGKPFYGYAIDSSSVAWHYFDGADSRWKLNVSGTRISVEQGGDVGIGVLDPLDRLHVSGTLRIDDPGTPQLRFHQGATFAGFIQSSGDEFVISNKLSGPLTLRTNDSPRVSIAENGDISMDQNTVFVDASSNRIGINETTPLDRIHLTGGNLRIENATAQLNFYQGTNFGAFIQSGSQNLLISNKNNGELQLRTNDVRRLAITDAGSVVIGTIAPATGYRLSIDGKVMAEEIKVQMSNLWPDYVFDQNYALMDIAELRSFIEKNNHLPGIPSAADVESAAGIELGEMNRLLLEKVEELTLYIVDLQDQIDALKRK